MIRHTHTHTSVYGVAPCGHRNPVPNDAYEEPVELDPCPGDGEARHPAASGLPLEGEPGGCGRRWIVLVLEGADPTAKFFPVEAGDVAVAFACALERTAADYGMVSLVPPHARIWEGIGLQRQAHFLGVATQLLAENVIEPAGSAARAVRAHEAAHTEVPVPAEGRAPGHPDELR